MSRQDIYYWKCDRPAAFHGTQARRAPDAELELALQGALRRYFDTPHVQLSQGGGQGNHLTWNAEVNGQALFVRVENGPEKDGQLAIESAVIERVRSTGVTTPKVHGCDASRREVPFAWQVLERIPAPDLNHWFKAGQLQIPQTAFALGSAVATWQALEFKGYGPLDARLQGYHKRYADYYHLRLEEHLNFLVTRGFLSPALQQAILEEIEAQAALLQLTQGCFVHKDLALWNVLGSASQIAAFIDFDDSICGDPMDDLSLLACFHDASFLQHAFEGYASVRPLPAAFMRRFWMHLLRNMIVKSVIRVGAGYFDRDDGFFLIGSGSSGASLRDFTLARLELALNGLRNDSPLSLL